MFKSQKIKTQKNEIRAVWGHIGKKYAEVIIKNGNIESYDLPQIQGYNVRFYDTEISVGCLDIHLPTPDHCKKLIEFLKTRSVEVLQITEEYWGKKGSRSKGFLSSTVTEITDKWIITKTGRAYPLEEYELKNRNVKIHPVEACVNGDVIYNGRRVTKQNISDCIQTLELWLETFHPGSVPTEDVDPEN